MSTEPVPLNRWTSPAEEVNRDTLRATLDIYEETIMLRFHDERASWARPLSADQLAHTFIRHMGFSSGLLPKDALWWNHGENGQTTALYRAPRIWPIALQTEPFKPAERFEIPMPPLVFVCNPGRAPRAYAAARRPESKEDRLYKIPTFNVFRDGRVCPGNHQFPEDVSEIPESFFESYFSMTGDSRGRSVRHPDSLLALWRELDGRKRYPLGDLVEQCSVGELMTAVTGTLL